MTCQHCGRELETIVIYNHTILRCPNIAVKHPPVVYVPTPVTTIAKTEK